MVTLKKISVGELPNLVQIAFKGDEELFNKYYQFKMDEMGCVNTTLLKIYETAKLKKLNYYKVVYSQKPIGFVVYFDNLLYSFGIELKHRKKDILLHWWDKITKTMPKQFACMLYAHNERAINFLKRNGMEVMDENAEENIITLVKN